MGPKRKKPAAAAKKTNSSPKATRTTKPSPKPSTTKPPKPTVTRSSPTIEEEEEEEEDILLPPKLPTKLQDKSQPKARAYQYYLLSRILANLIEIENQDRKGDGFYGDVADATRAVEASLIDLYENGKVVDEWVHEIEEEEGAEKETRGGR